MALLVAMEQLSPAERVSLILHDVFGVPFAEIADIVGRTPEASRQLATSARRNIRRQPRFDVQGAERDRVVLAFAKACRDGDVEALAAVLDPNVVSRADGGTVVTVARKPVVGAVAVARYLLGVLTRRQELGGPVEVDDGTGERPDRARRPSGRRHRRRRRPRRRRRSGRRDHAAGESGEARCRRRTVCGD